MKPENESTVIRTYLGITFFNTLAASFIWGINTLFLLDAGLSNFEAFLANAFFSVGMVLFEVPTGVVADTVGRRASFLLGCTTLFLTTICYLALWKFHGSIWLWCLVSLLLGLGFTFFSGAVEAWLVDALNFVGFQGNLEDVFAKGQVIDGMAMLAGTASGGYIAQLTNLGAPYLFRIGALVISFILAAFFMKDIGFTPRKLENIGNEMMGIFKTSLDKGIKVSSIRWIILTSPFLMGVMFYGFYAAQPYLLQLYGDPKAYAVAGLAATLFAGSEIIGGLLVPYLRRFFSRRSRLMLFCIVGVVLSLVGLGLANRFGYAVFLLSIWSLLIAAFTPVKLAYLNKCLSSNQRATILSFDGMMGSVGGVVFQPILGRAADFYSYSTSFLLSAIIQAGAIPFIILAARANSKADQIGDSD